MKTPRLTAKPERVERLSASGVLDGLRNGPWPEASHAWLYEVCNRTGYGGTMRFADALVISSWPSRGIWFAGVEAKVSRSDWVRELEKPDKSEPIQKFCHYWWLATEQGVVHPGEVPETWGHYVVTRGQKPKLVKAAPRLKPVALAPAFVASVLRNAAGGLRGVREQARLDGYQDAKAKLSKGASDEQADELLKLRQEVGQLTRELEWKSRNISQLEHERKEFSRHAGLGEHGLAIRGEQRNIGAQFRAAGVLAQHPPERLADVFGELAEAFDKLSAVAQDSHT